jgi:hypothetical protein
MFQIATAHFRNENRQSRIVKRGGQRQLLPMDILASMLAYLVCVSSVIGALALSFALVFAPPNFLHAAAPSQATAIHVTATQATAMVVTPQVVATVAEAKPASEGKPLEQHVAASTPQTAAAAPDGVAADAQQKTLTSRRQLRRLGDTERARRLAYREGSSFEARFLHYND